MLLEIQLSFAILLADLARITSVFFDPNLLGILGSAFFQMLFGFPRRLELHLSFTLLRADLARITSVSFDFDVLRIFGSAFFQMLFGFPRRLKLLVALRALFVIGGKLQRIFSALLSQHFLKFLARVCVIRLF